MICEKWHINSTRYDIWRMLIIKLYTFQQTAQTILFFRNFVFLKLFINKQTMYIYLLIPTLFINKQTM